MTEEVKAEAQARLRELAKLIAPRNYTWNRQMVGNFDCPTQASFLMKQEESHLDVVVVVARNYQGMLLIRDRRSARNS